MNPINFTANTRSNDGQVSKPHQQNSQAHLLLFIDRDWTTTARPEFESNEEEVIAMSKDTRELIDVLQQELDFIEKGGYGRSVRTPWLEKSIFQDSLSCLNYGYPYRAHPCNECLLHDFVPPQDQLRSVPCHHIKLDGEGDTIAELEQEGNESRTEHLVKDWLRTQLDEKQRELDMLMAER